MYPSKRNQEPKLAVANDVDVRRLAELYETRTRENMEIAILEEKVMALAGPCFVPGIDGKAVYAVFPKAHRGSLVKKMPVIGEATSDTNYPELESNTGTARSK